MANEKRLIDANAIEAKIEKIFRKMVASQRKPDLAAALSYVGDLILEAPTVDAVEVRCAKCKHYQQYHKGRTEDLCEWGKCKLISMDIDMPSNGFCCFGERRTE